MPHFSADIIKQSELGQLPLLCERSHVHCAFLVTTRHSKNKNQTSISLTEPLIGRQRKSAENAMKLARVLAMLIQFTCIPPSLDEYEPVFIYAGDFCTRLEHPHSRSPFSSYFSTVLIKVLSTELVTMKNFISATPGHPCPDLKKWLKARMLYNTSVTRDIFSQPTIFLCI